MNNEPVAWMETYKGEPNNLDWDKSNLNYGSEFHDVVPLYTNPVKELTNDEMRKVINEIVDGVTVSEMVTFLAISKAILRKAQEK